MPLRHFSSCSARHALNSTKIKMGDWNVIEGTRWEALKANPPFFTVPGSGSANTKGAYTQLIAATSFDYDAIAMWLQGDVTGASIRHLSDLAVGGVGSEKVIIPNISTFSLAVGSGFFVTTRAIFPVAVPAGSRLSMACQTSVGGLNVYPVVHGLAGAFTSMPQLGRALSIGADTAT